MLILEVNMWHVKFVFLSVCILIYGSVSCTSIKSDIERSNSPEDVVANPKVAEPAEKGDNNLGASEKCSSSTLEALLRQLKDKEIMVALRAGDELAAIGKRAVPSMIELLRGQNLELRERAADILGKIGPEAEASIPILIEAIRDEDKGLRRSAVVALGRIGRAAIPALVTALRDGEAEVRIAAAGALDVMGNEAKDASQALEVALDDENHDVRIFAAAATISFDPSQEKAMSIIRRGLQSKDKDVRFVTVWAIASVQSYSKVPSHDLVDLLIEVTHDDDFGGRESAFRALAAVGDDSPEYIRALIEGIRNRALCQGLLAKRLVNIGQPAVSMVITLFDDPDDGIQSTAIGILGSIGPQAKEAIPFLVSRLRDRQYTGNEAGAALGRIGGRDAVPSIIGLLEDNDPNVRYHAAISLANIGPDAWEAVPALLKHLQDEDKRVRGGAAGAIDSIGFCDAAVIEKLEERMREDKKPRIRRWAADAIKRLKESGKCENRR